MEFSLLAAGLFTITDAAELVAAKKPELRVWVEGRPGKQLPIIENTVGRIGNKTAVSFTNLMELRFVALFVKAGVRLNEIRAILQEAQATLNHPHPFATNIVFRTDGRRIVAEIARSVGVDNIYDLKSRNYEFRELIIDQLKEAVIFDPKGDAIAWRPRRKIAPHVYIHPSISFGKPVIMPQRIPVEAVANAVRVEGSAAIVADLYELPIARVREAVGFDRALQKAA